MEPRELLALLGGLATSLFTTLLRGLLSTFTSFLCGHSDLSILDQERSVARQSRVQNGALIHRTQIPEACYQQTTLGRMNQVLERSGAAAHANRIARASGLASLFLCPIPIVVEILHHAV